MRLNSPAHVVLPFQFWNDRAGSMFPDGFIKFLRRRLVRNIFWNRSLIAPRANRRLRAYEAEIPRMAGYAYAAARFCCFLFRERDHGTSSSPRLTSCISRSGWSLRLATRIWTDEEI